MEDKQVEVENVLRRYNSRMQQLYFRTVFLQSKTMLSPEELKELVEIRKTMEQEVNVFRANISRLS